MLDREPLVSATKYTRLTCALLEGKGPIGVGVFFWGTNPLEGLVRTRGAELPSTSPVVVQLQPRSVVQPRLIRAQMHARCAGHLSERLNLQCIHAPSDF